MERYNLGEVTVSYLNEKGKEIRTLQFNSKYSVTGGNIFEELEESISSKLKNEDTKIEEVYEKISRSNIYIPGEITVSNFRFILAAEFNIPIFRLALFNRVESLYRIILPGSGGIVEPTEEELIRPDPGIQFHADLPIDMNMCESAYYRVETKEHVKSVRSLSEYSHFYIYDLGDFIGDKNKRKQIMLNQTSIDYIYKGFVAKFWPICSHDIYMSMLAATDFEAESRALLGYYPQMNRSREYIKDFTVMHEKAYNISRTSKYNKFLKNTAVSIKNATSEIDYRLKEIDLFSMFEEIHTDATICIINYVRSDGIVLRKSFTPKMAEPNMLVDPPSLPISYTKAGLTLGIWVDLSADIDAVRAKQFIYLNFNNTISLISVWREDYRVDFKKHLHILKKYVNPIIQNINKIRHRFYSEDFQLFEDVSTIFTNIIVIMSVPISISADEFSRVAAHLNYMQALGIITFGKFGLSLNEQLIFNVIQGPMNHDPFAIDLRINSDSFNYYSWMYDPSVIEIWHSYYPGATVKIDHRMSDLRIEIQNVRMNGLTVCRFYLMSMLASLNLTETENNYKNIKKKIFRLRNMDPILFNYRDTRSEKTKLYSIACQEPKQPMIYSERELDKLSAGRRNRLVEYWNFTQNEKAYYECPNSEYPHFGLQTDIHPSGFCLPCCQKTDTGKKEPDLLQNCIKQENEKGEGKSFRHILELLPYPIETGRLGKLKWLEAYISGSRAEISFLYGVPQTLPNFINCGIIFSISCVLNKSLEEFIQMLISVSSETDLNRDMQEILLKRRIEYPNNRTIEEWIEAISNLTSKAYNIGIYFIDYGTKTVTTSKMVYANNILLLKKPQNIVEPIRTVELKKYFRLASLGEVDSSVFNSIFTEDDIKSILPPIKTKFAMSKKFNNSSAVIIGESLIGRVWFAEGQGLYVPLDLARDFNSATELREIPINRLTWKPLKEYFEINYIYPVSAVLSGDMVQALIDQESRIFFTNTNISEVSKNFQIKNVINWHYGINEIYFSLYNSDSTPEFISADYSQKYVLYHHLFTIFILAVQENKNIRYRQDILSILKSGEKLDGLRMTESDAYEINRFIFQKNIHNIRNKKWDEVEKNFLEQRFDFDDSIYFDMRNMPLTNLKLRVQEMISPYVKFGKSSEISEIFHDISKYKNNPLLIDPEIVHTDENTLIEKLALDIQNPFFEQYFLNKKLIYKQRHPLYNIMTHEIPLTKGERLEIID